MTRYMGLNTRCSIGYLEGERLFQLDWLPTVRHLSGKQWCPRQVIGNSIHVCLIQHCQIYGVILISITACSNDMSWF